MPSTPTILSYDQKVPVTVLLLLLLLKTADLILKYKQPGGPECYICGCASLLMPRRYVLALVPLC